MQKGNVHYKQLHPESVVAMRAVPMGRSDYRLITNSKRRAKPAAGFVVESATTYPVGALVELELKFPGQPSTYRARGMVSWISEGEEPTSRHKIWILISRMEKLGEDSDLRRAAGPSATVVQPPLQEQMGNQAAFASAPQQETTAFNQAEASATAAASDATPQSPQAGSEQASESVAQSAPEELKTALIPPNAQDAADLLTNLVGEEVQVKQVDVPLEFSQAASVSSFVSDEKEVLTLCVMDFAAMNWLGAALAMIPKATVEGDVRAKKLSDEVKENVGEIVNISSSMFNKPDGPHHRFDQLYIPAEGAFPDEVQTVIENPADRVDFEIEVPGYGTGRVSYFLAAWSPQSQKRAAPEEADAPSPSSIETPDVSADAAESELREAPVSNPSGKPIVPPQANDVSEMLTSLVGEDVPVKKVDTPLTEGDYAVLGDFISDDDKPLVLCVMDFAAMNWLGAALPMIPKATVEDDVRARKFSDEVKENIGEIFNISASMFNKPDSIHHRFRTLHLPQAEELAGEIKELVDQPANRIDFEIEVPEYGTGRVSYLTGWM
ncbi:MAG: hypothetical protein GY854_13330 [Deltaproteobacteria bacterium]|nr:hypothetical protein [Deltaproteobacteria bacterium]